MPLMGAQPHLMKPPSEKTTPQLKREAPFHEMIPRKSTIYNNLQPGLKSLKNMCEEVHFSKFAGLQAYSWLISNELLHRYLSTAF